MADLLETLSRSALDSEALGIGLLGASDEACFRWLLASLCCSGRCPPGAGGRAYRLLESHGLTSAAAVSEAGERYVTACALAAAGFGALAEGRSLQICRCAGDLLGRYGGSLARLHRTASDPEALSVRLLALAGMTPAARYMFLRELRPFWLHADPPAAPAVLRAALRFGLRLNAMDRKSIAFARTEAGLLRLAALPPWRAPAAAGPC